VAFGTIAAVKFFETVTVFWTTLETEFDKGIWVPLVFKASPDGSIAEFVFDGQFVSNNQKEQRANKRKILARMTFRFE
jgi:hypothetical protein